MRNILSILVALLVLVGLSLLPEHNRSSGDPQIIQGEVVYVSDGDTLTLRDNLNQDHRIRLVGIDAPELAQPYGQTSKQVLAQRVLQEQVVIKSYGTDKYGRTLGRILLGAQDINAVMVERGAAWVYRGSSVDKTLMGLESQARSEKRGLWKLPRAEQVNPQTWRRLQSP